MEAWEGSTQGPFAISDQEFEALRHLVYQRFGIALSEQKRVLMATRLCECVRKLGLASFQQYHQYVLADRSGQALSHLANLISTNHTFFLREQEHFQFLQQTLLPPLLQSLREQKTRDLRTWCAASSSGEEPYGLLMTLMESLGREYTQWKAGLLATDISTKALETARLGIYREDQMQEIPNNWRQAYFQRLSDGSWQVKPAVRQEVTFRRFNLMEPQFPFKQPFHVIFCRNVMIYFDASTKSNLLQKLYEVTLPGGYLFVGLSESLNGLHHSFRYVQPAVYRRDP